MTKKDYIQAAKIFQRNRVNFDNEPGALDALIIVEMDFADWFEQDNPRFDREKFLKACKGE